MATERTTCKFCKAELPEGKTLYCSLACARRAQKRRARQKNPDRVAYLKFAETVPSVLSLADLAERSGRPLEEIREKAAVDIRRGRLRGVEEKGELAYVGRPLREGEESQYTKRAREIRENREQLGDDGLEGRLRAAQIQRGRNKRRRRRVQREAASR